MLHTPSCTCRAPRDETVNMGRYKAAFLMVLLLIIVQGSSVMMCSHATDVVAASFVPLLYRLPHKVRCKLMFSMLRAASAAASWTFSGRARTGPGCSQSLHGLVFWARSLICRPTVHLIYGV
jgi:hypothetical protein